MYGGPHKIACLLRSTKSIDVPAFVELALTPGPEVASGKTCLN